MLILLEGPDENRNDLVSSALRYYHEDTVELWPDEERGLEDGERFTVPEYQPGEPSVIPRDWLRTAVVVNDTPAFNFRTFKAVETHLGKRGALGVYVAPPAPDPEWDIVAEGSRLPQYVIEADANLNLSRARSWLSPGSSLSGLPHRARRPARA